MNYVPDSTEIAIGHLFITCGTIAEILQVKGLMTQEEWKNTRRMMTEIYCMQTGLSMKLFEEKDQ